MKNPGNGQELVVLTLAKKWGVNPGKAFGLVSGYVWEATLHGRRPLWKEVIAQHEPS